MPMPHPHEEAHAFPVNEPQRGAKGYSWLFFYASRSWKIAFFMSLTLIGAAGLCYLWYMQSGNETFPGDMMGLGFAFPGTFFLLLATVLYTVQRRSRRRGVGQLNAALNWHMFCAIIGLALLFMHALGHFALISGTFALYGMIALTISGVIGRLLDRVLPRLIAREVHTVLTMQGDDRIDVISQKLQAIVLHNNQKLHGFTLPSTEQPPPTVPSQLSTPTKGSMAPRGMTLHGPWDMAFISLEPTQQELDRSAHQHRFIPDKKSALNRPEIRMPGAEEQLAALQDVNAALRREQFYRYIIRYWRIVHIALVFVTIGLVIWHLIFAMMILFPKLF